MYSNAGAATKIEKGTTLTCSELELLESDIFLGKFLE